MSEIRSMEIQTVSKIVQQSAASNTIGGQVPANMKRWVTFMMFDSDKTVEASSIGVYLASVTTANPTVASVIATANRKLVVMGSALNGGQSNSARPFMVPPSGPDPDVPLFSIAGGSYLGVYATLATANVFAQYFDE